MATKKLQLAGVRLVNEEDYGKSAYEIALDNGFVGTEVEWIASLKGEKGEKGDTPTEEIASLDVRKADTVQTKTGSIIDINNDIRLPVKDLKLFGKTTHSAIPTTSSPAAFNSVGDNGSITVSITDGGGTTNQNLIVTTHNALCGFPTTMRGDYTDMSGQQWLCDEIDFERGMYVKRTNIVDMGTLDWIYSSTFGYFYASINDKNIEKTPVLSTVYKTVFTTSTFVDNTIIGSYLIKQKTINVRDKVFNGDAAAFKESVSGQLVLYRLETPVEIPLTEEELTTYANLYTDASNTTIVNDANADMEIAHYSPFTAVPMVYTPEDEGKLLSINHDGLVTPVKPEPTFHEEQELTVEQQKQARKNLDIKHISVESSQPNPFNTDIWINPDSSRDSVNPYNAIATYSLVGLVLNESLNNTVARYATIQDALDGKSAIADGKVLAYTCGGRANIMILDDVESDIAINVTKDCVLHLNGKTLSLTAQGAYICVTDCTMVINGEVEGSVIRKENIVGIADENEYCILTKNTNLTMYKGEYIMSNITGTNAAYILYQDSECSLDMYGSSMNMRVACTGLMVFAGGVGNKIEKCSLYGECSGEYSMYGVSVADESVITECRVLTRATAKGGRSIGIYVNAGTTTITDCVVEGDGYSDLDGLNPSSDEVRAAYAIRMTSASTTYINGGYYFGAREALSAPGTLYVNGGVYEGCQHGGGYLSGDIAKIQNAIFRNIEYTGVCGWENPHYGIVYCGGSSGETRVYFNNCRFETELESQYGITIKYTDTYAYLSNIDVVGNVTSRIRIDANNTVYIGKNVSAVPSGGGTIDKTTYADQEFDLSDEMQKLSFSESVYVKDGRGCWVGIR